jgi:hypothetical protein
MNCQHQLDAARALRALAAAMASLTNSVAQYRKYFKIDTENYINANYKQEMQRERSSQKGINFLLQAKLIHNSLHALE